MDTLLKIHPLDTVAVCRDALAKGIRIGDLTVLDDIPAGHKVALCAMAAGDWVWKYGFPIGQTTAAIAPGEHVHMARSPHHGSEDSASFRLPAMMVSPPQP